MNPLLLFIIIVLAIAIPLLIILQKGSWKTRVSIALLAVIISSAYQWYFLYPWKIYKNQEYGFQVNYFWNWNINDQSYIASAGLGEGKKVAALEVYSPVTYVLPGYGDGAHYSIQFFFSGNKAIVDHQGFIAEKKPTDQAPVDISLSDSILKQSPEYKMAQKIIKSAKVTN